jgi:putative transcriptional regulator
MPLSWFKRPLLALAALLLPASLLHAALQDPGDTPAQPSLTGQLLIASPTLRDSRFYHTVVLLVRHNPGGAFGIVINRLLGERPLANVLEAMGEKDEGVTGNLRIFYGGPVQPEVGLVIHSGDYHLDDTIPLSDHVAVTSSRQILRDIATKHGPEKALVAFGYAGWASGQLEGELARRDWYTAGQDSKLIFDEDRDKVWDDAVAHRTQDL